MAQNTTVIKLYKDVPVDGSYSDVYGGDYADMLAAAETLTYTEQAYQNPYSGINRPPRTVTIPTAYESLEGYNYMSFQNSPSGRVYYAFIDSGQSLAENVTRLSYMLDFWGTYYGNITVGRSYVEREHVLDDSAANWGAAESLNYTELLPQQTQDIAMGGTLYFYALVVPPIGESEREKYLDWKGRYIGTDKDVSEVTGAYSGVNAGFSTFRTTDAASFNQAFGDVQTLTNDGISLGLAGRGLGDCIIRAFASRVQYGGGNKESTFNLVPGDFAFGGYVPHNKKCFDSPFRQYSISSYQGGHVELSARKVYEWGGLSVTHGIIDSLGAGRYLKVNDPNGSSRDILYSSCEVDLPTANNNGAAAALQQKNALITGLINSAISTAGGLAVTAATGGAALPSLVGTAANSAEALTSFARSSREAFWQDYSVSLPSVGLDNIDLILGRTGFNFTAYGMPAAAAKRIDEYFDCYGYAVQSYKVPNMAGMTLYNFVKTAGAVVTGAVPAGVLETIKRILDSGVRIWHVLPGTAGQNRRST